MYETLDFRLSSRRSYDHMRWRQASGIDEASKVI